MQQSLEPVARELNREVRSLKARLGARQVTAARDAGGAETSEAAGRAGSTASQVAAAGSEEIDLLWPAGRPAGCGTLDPATIRDLDLERVVQAMVPGARARDEEELAEILTQLCPDAAVIRYRQEVLADLLAYPGLLAGLEALLPAVDRLAIWPLDTGMPSLFQVTWWLGELETFVQCVQLAAAALRQVRDQSLSDGLEALRRQVRAVEEAPSFQSLVRELPDLLARMRGVTSVTIGVNVDDELRPVAATLLSVNDQPFTEAGLLRMLLHSTGEFETVMPLHSVPSAVSVGMGREKLSPMLIPLFRDLSRVLEQVSRPVAQALEKYVHLNRHFLARLRPALAFYIGAIHLMRRLEAGGLPTCVPEIAPAEERVCEVQAAYNVALALHVLDQGVEDAGQVVVGNDVSLNDEGRIIILTGPNRGGKTTYTQSIGILQVLAQAGLRAPGRRARISPADNIYTHFPVEEEVLQGSGRFGDEAKRLEAVFARATRHSLVLLNESLSGTHAGESLYLARDIVRVWRLLGARVVFATHLHELAAQVEELNRETPGDSPIASMVSSLLDPDSVARATPGQPEAATERSYRVIKSPPMGRSYARELAMVYGISFEQLSEMLAERGVLPGPTP